MQNRLDELWAIVNIASPGTFSDKKTFNDYYVTPILRERQRNVSEQAQEEGRQRSAQLQTTLKTLYLRRDKRELLHQLPRKFENVVFCDMSGLQQSVYRRLLGMPEAQLNLIDAAEDCPCSSGEKRKAPAPALTHTHTLARALTPNRNCNPPLPHCVCSSSGVTGRRAASSAPPWQTGSLMPRTCGASCTW